MGREKKPGSPLEYFGEREEAAIERYLDPTISEVERNKIYKTIIGPCLRKLVKGVLKMPKFQKIIGKSIEELEEEAYYHVLFQVPKFTPGRIGISGQPVKAYSYLGTCAKHFILHEKIKSDSLIARYGGMLDSDDLAEVIVEKQQVDIQAFEELKKEIIFKIEKQLANKKNTECDILVGNCLKYMLINWHKMSFNSKNDFMRLLSYISGVDQVSIAKTFKKLKINLITAGLVKEKEKEIKRFKKTDVDVSKELSSTNYDDIYNSISF